MAFCWPRRVDVDSEDAMIICVCNKYSALTFTPILMADLDTHGVCSVLVVLSCCCFYHVGCCFDEMDAINIVPSLSTPILMTDLDNHRICKKVVAQSNEFFGTGFYDGVSV